jgi:hypothetical protein
VGPLDTLDQLREPIAGVGEGHDGHVSRLPEVA